MLSNNFFFLLKVLLSIISLKLTVSIFFLCRSESALKWLRTLVILHAAHLVSNPDITEVFAPLFPLIESKLNVIGPLYKLAGRLDLMIQQIKHRTDKSEQSLQSVSLQPKLIYQDEGSFSIFSISIN